MAKTTGMGRGLSAILSVSAPQEGEAQTELRSLPVELIAPNPRQPRKHFDQESLAALASSLQASGVIQPILVRPRAGGTYELVAGERRWRAAQLAGLDTVPALVHDHTDAASIVREKGQNSDWKYALSANPSTKGAPCPQTTNPSITMPENPPSAAVTQKNGMGLSAPQGAECTVAETLNGGCLKKLKGIITSSGGVFSAGSSGR